MPTPAAELIRLIEWCRTLETAKASMLVASDFRGIRQVCEAALEALTVE